MLPEFLEGRDRFMDSAEEPSAQGFERFFHRFGFPYKGILFFR